MTVVLVHGNPETEAIWAPLRAELGRDDVVCLSPPGFGAPIPGDFGATVLEYRDWLIGELETFGEPVDLVGHDWGGGHVVNVAMTRPDLLRSWTSDAVGLFAPDYVWHPLARSWQTPGEGERAVAVFSAPFAERVDLFLGRGNDREIAEVLAAGQTAEMAAAVLALYRSAAQPVMAQLGQGLAGAARRPGLCLVATADQAMGSVGLRTRAATTAGARVVVLEGLSHWWMLQDPGQGARVLTEFWAQVS